MSLPADFLRSPAQFERLPVYWYKEGEREQLIPVGMHWVGLIDSDDGSFFKKPLLESSLKLLLFAPIF